ncbi:MAG: disulfide oxidoreductase [Caldilineaceae bacterium]|nr:disulfide oxidoreductase [Caldilineaceae bacterium]
MNSSRFWVRLGLYSAFTAAWVSMMGSLYFSEVMRFTPCTLCWFQRVLMYPLAGLIAFGILRRDHHLPFLVLPFSLLGQGLAVYHYLLQKTTIFSQPSSCGLGVTCSSVWIDWFGIVTIPLLSVFGFMVITIGMLMVIAGGENRPNLVGANRWPRWPVPFVVVIALALYAAEAVRAGEMEISLPDIQILVPSSFPFLEFSTDSAATPEPTATPTNQERGESIYSQACASCHGAQGEGVEGLGTPLSDSPYVAELSDDKLLALIRDGRAADADDNRTGLAMPARGGQSELSDEQIGYIILVIRNWQ